jgi:hypothetical protein
MCKSSPGAAPGEISAPKVAAEYASAHDLYQEAQGHPPRDDGAQPAPLPSVALKDIA